MCQQSKNSLKILLQGQNFNNANISESLDSYIESGPKLVELRN